jgi:hypothetical protein
MFQSRQNFQQSGFSGTIFSGKANPVFGINQETDSLE